MVTTAARLKTLLQDTADELARLRALAGELAAENERLHAENETFRRTGVRPSTVFKPDLSRDGNVWCFLYGDDVAEGIAGFGDTPEQAAQAFDIAWQDSLA